jgi:hypothetical protein
MGTHEEPLAFSVKARVALNRSSVRCSGENCAPLRPEQRVSSGRMSWQRLPGEDRGTWTVAIPERLQERSKQARQGKERRNHTRAILELLRAENAYLLGLDTSDEKS